MNKNLFLRELKINLKPFLIWSLLTGGLYLVILLIYPYIITGNNINDMMAMFPPELLQALNMDLASIATASGWLASEGLLFYLLLGGLYASILGSTILLKEENDHTIDYLYAKPLNKRQILTSKILCGIVYILGFVLVVGGFNLVALAIDGDLDLGQMFWLLYSPFMVFVICFLLLLLISCWLRRTKHSMVISFAVVFGFYFFTLVSSISDQVSWLKYLSIFTLSDSRYILSHNALSPWCLVIFVVLAGALLGVTYWQYRRKEYHD